MKNDRVLASVANFHGLVIEVQGIEAANVVAVTSLLKILVNITHIEPDPCTYQLTISKGNISHIFHCDKRHFGILLNQLSAGIV